MAERFYPGGSPKPLAMAGFGRGLPFYEEDQQSRAAEDWAFRVRQSSASHERCGLPNDTIQNYIEELELIWTNDSFPDRKKKSQAVYKKVADAARRSYNPWETALNLVIGTSDFRSAKTASLAFTILAEFQKWVASKENHLQGTPEEDLCLTQDIRMQAYSTFSGQHHPFFLVASKAFHLNHPGNEYFLPQLQDILNHNKLAEASSMIGALGLQDHFSQDEVMIPLLLSDKVNLLEAYVSGNQHQQEALLSLLDHLCARTTDLLSFAQNANVKNVKGQKLSKKIISKLAVRLMKLYNIPPETCPNITESRAMSAIRYLLYRKYVEKSLGSGSWDDMVESAVGMNPSLQQQLVQELLAYNDLSEAARWAMTYQLDNSTLDSSVAVECRRLRELKNKQMSQAAGGSRHNSDGPSGSTGEEDWDAVASTSSLSKSQYYSIPLSREQVTLVDTRGKVRNCLHRLGQPGTTIGLDAEWKPTMGAGTTQRIALLQLAVEEAVFLLDIVALSEILTEQEWVEIGETIFCREDTLKLGFGLDHDIRMLVRTFPCLSEPLSRIRRITDVEKLAAKVLFDPGQGSHTAPDSNSGYQNKDIRPNTSGHFQKSEEKGLSLVVKKMLGRSLSKEEQMSNWERRPLRQSQVDYAASDAYVLLDLHKVLVARGQAIGLSGQDLEPPPTAKVKSKMDKRKDRVASGSGKAKEPNKSQAMPAPSLSTSHNINSNTSNSNIPTTPSTPIAPSQLRVVCNNMLQGLGSQLRTCGVDTVILGRNSPHMEAVQISRREDRIILSCGKVFDQIRSAVSAGMCLCVPHTISSRDQCVFVLSHYGVAVRQEDIFSRCSVCNSVQFAHVPSRDFECLAMIALQQKQQATHRHGYADGRDGSSPYEVDQGVRSKFIQFGIDAGTVSFLHNKVHIQVETVPSAKIFRKVSHFYVCKMCGKVYWEGSHYENISGQFVQILTLGDSLRNEGRQSKGRSRWSGRDDKDEGSATPERGEISSAGHRHGGDQSFKKGKDKMSQDGMPGARRDGKRGKGNNSHSKLGHGSVSAAAADVNHTVVYGDFREDKVAASTLFSAAGDDYYDDDDDDYYGEYDGQSYVHERGYDSRF